MLKTLFRNEIAGPPVRPGYWFAQKRYGFGAVPATVMGWVTTIAYVLVLLACVAAMRTDVAKIILGTSITLAWLAIVWLKTDGGWRWRWGGD